MFTITEQPTFRWPVTFQWPNDQGEFDEHSFTAIFRRRPQSELVEAAAEVQEANHSFEARAKFLRLVVKGFEGVEAGDRTPEQIMDFMLDDGAIITALFTTYASVYAGQAEGNSERPPEDSTD